MSIVRAADIAVTPWKNGMGRTRELAIHPAGADLSDFAWRVSVAEVDSAAPFSMFPGVDRQIALLQGAGFVMRFADGREHRLEQPHAPFAFPGEAAVDVVLLGGATRDFNLMLRRGRASGGVVVARDAATTIAPARFRLSYAAAGAHECLFAGHPPVHVAADHALLIESEPAVPFPLAIHPLGGDAVALVVRIDVNA